MISFRRHRIWSALTFVVALPFAAGCAQETTGGAASPDAARALTERGPDGAFRPHGPGGPDFLLVAALHELTLSDAQKATIETALEKARPEPKERGPKGGAAIKALAEGVRAGTIDEAAVKAQAGEPGPGFEERRAAMTEALATLHATLTKEQRRALVDVVAKRAEEHGPGRGHHGPKGDRGPGSEGHRGPLGHLLRDLDLSEAQRADIAKALEAQRPAPPDREAMKKGFEAMRTEMRARLETFAADTFDAATFGKPPAGVEGPPDHGPRAHLERMVKELSVVVPLLQPAQREKLAAQIEKGPPGPEGRRHHGPRGGSAL